MLLKYDTAREVRTPDRLALVRDAARVIRVQSRHEPQQRGFSTAAGAKYADEFAGGHVQGHLIQHVERPAGQNKRLADGAQPQKRGR